MERRLSDLRFPMEYHAEVLRERGSEQLRTGTVLGVAAAALLAAYLLLQAALVSWRLAALVLAALPVALSGGVVAALASGVQLHLGALLGLVAVLGLTARTAVLLLAPPQAADGAGAPSAADRVVGAAGERFPAVLGSVLAVALLAVPFVVLGDRPGLEVLHPMAVVLLGGLVTSLVATLLVVPVLGVHLVRYRGGEHRDPGGGDSRDRHAREADAGAARASRLPLQTGAAAPDASPVRRPAGVQSAEATS